MEDNSMNTVSKLKPTKLDFIHTVNLLSKNFAARAAGADETDAFVLENYHDLKTSGLIAAGVPVELGGGGADVIELSNILRIMAHSCGSTALAFAMHTQQVAIPAWRWQHQKVVAVEPLLKRIAAENIVIMTSGGSDWIAGSGKAERVEGGYKITARKVFASASPVGSLLMTSAVLEEAGEPPMVLHFGIPMTSPQVRIDHVWKTMGMRGTASNDVLIEGHFVPEAGVALKRKAGEWHPLFQVIATIAIPLIYSVYVGVAENARSIALGLAKKRRNDHNITSLVGLMDTELCGAKLALQHMLNVATHHTPSAESVNEVMMGRNLVATHAIKAVDLAMEAAGGTAYYRASGLERCFRDIQGARYHPMQQGQQAAYAGSMALGLPIDKIY
jgi:indole-3-acetate monooxygenase